MFSLADVFRKMVLSIVGMLTISFVVTSASVPLAAVTGTENAQAGGERVVAGPKDVQAGGERVHVRHILFKTVNKSDEEKKTDLAKARQILAKLNKGADFANLAKLNSDDKTTKDKGGDLGWILRGQTFPEFEKAVFTLKPKHMELITTPLGYQIVQVLEYKPASARP